jgi:hypothetical protein
VTTLGAVAFAPQITAAAERYGLQPALLAAVAAQETGGPGATSGANIVGDGGHGHGLFQIDDRYHAFATTAAAMDPAQNAGYAAGMISGLLQKFGGNVKAALSAYNAGSPTATGTVTQWSDGAKLGYADSVLRHEAAYTTTATARDAAMPDLAETAAGVNELQNLASASQAQSSSSASDASALTASPAPALPPVQTESSAQRAQSQAPLTQDYYADGDDGDSKGASWDSIR